MKSSPRRTPQRPTIRVRRIRPDEWTLLRELRLRSLADSPEAFGGSYEESLRAPDAEWRAATRAAADGDRRAWFVAERTPPDGTTRSEPVGLVLARRRPPDACLLFSLWVAPEARRQRVGVALVDAVEEWGAGWGARHVVLWVVATNEPAVTFYERLGFERLTTGPDADSGRTYRAYAMRRPVTRRSREEELDPA